MNQQHATAGPAASTSGAGLGYRDPSLARPVAERAGWQEIDVRAVDTARLLAADAVQKAGNGHPARRPPAAFAPPAGRTADCPA